MIVSNSPGAQRTDFPQHPAQEVGSFNPEQPALREAGGSLHSLQNLNPDEDFSKGNQPMENMLSHLFDSDSPPRSHEEVPIQQHEDDLLANILDMGNSRTTQPRSKDEQGPPLKNEASNSSDVADKPQTRSQDPAASGATKDDGGPGTGSGKGTGGAKGAGNDKEGGESDGKTGDTGEFQPEGSKQAESLGGKVEFYAKNKEDAEKLKENFDKLYENDPDFKKHADSVIEKHGKITATAKELGQDKAGVAQIDGSKMAIDLGALDDHTTIGHELLHLAGYEHGSELNAEEKKVSDMA